MIRRQPGPDESGSQDTAGQSLRKRAEEPHYPESDLPPQARQLLHELRVSQVELETQNEELRQTQEKLETSRAKYFDFYNRSTVGYFTVSEPGLIREVNLTSANLLGIELDRLLNQPFTKLVVSEDQDIYYLFHKRLFETGEPQTCELRMARQDGGIFWARLRATVYEDMETGESTSHTVMSDITESRRVEEALRKSQLRFRSTFDQAAVGITHVALDGHFLEVNQKLCDIVGYTREELLALTFQDITHPDDLELDLSYKDKLMEGAIPNFSMEKRYLRKDGTIVWINLTVSLARSLDGNLDYFIGVIEDISDRKQAEGRQQESERKYRQLTEQASEGIFVVDQKGRYLDVNPAGLEMVGYSFEELRGMIITDLMPPDDLKKAPSRFPEILAGKTVINERTLQRKDGSLFLAEITAKLMTDGNILATKRDITERKRREGEKTAYIYHLMSLNRVYKAFDPTLDLETALPVALREILSVFDCDRAFLLYPLDKDAKTYKIPFEQTKPEYPGAFTANKDLPITKEVAGIFRIALGASAPVSMNLVEGITDEALVKEFDIKTQLVVPLFPKTGKPWMLGLHQCSRVREWTKEEKELFHAISLVISDKLSNLLLVRNLSESEERHRILFNNASVGIGIYDEDRQIVDANKTLLKMMGYSRQELMDMRFNGLLTLKQDTDSLFERLSKDGEVHDFETKLRKKDGSEFGANLTVTRYNLGGQRVTQIMILDITERKRAEEALAESEEKYRNMIENSPDLIYAFSIQRGGIYYSGATEAVLGYSIEYLLQHPYLWAQSIHPDDSTIVKNAVESFLEGKSYDIEYRIRTFDGSWIWLRDRSIARRTTGNDELIIEGVASDISERKWAEEKLFAAKELAERANKAKSVFLSSMSHEIRTPLTSVIGFSQLLSTDSEHPLSDFQKQLLGKVMDSGDQLLELINSALDLAKIESGDIAMSIEAVEVNSLATMALTSSAHMAKEYGVKLISRAPSVDCYVMADSILLRQVLTNLLSNAIKYNKKGGETILSWKPHDENKVRICVSDEGIGIPEDSIENLYKPFDRLGMEGRNIKGFGIGLTIVKRLIETMGGEVGVESQVGKGSTFYIDIPTGKKPR